MRNSLLAGVAAALLAGSAAQAQTTVTTTRTFDLPPQEEVTVREYVAHEHPAPASIVIERHMTVRPGSIIPEDVPLHPLRAIGTPNLARYAYFLSPDHKIVIVDPDTREVLRIISQPG